MGGFSVNFEMSYGQVSSAQTPSVATLFIPSRIIAPLSVSIVPSIARSL